MGREVSTNNPPRVSKKRREDEKGMKEGKKKGRKEGKEEGRREGRKEARKEGRKERRKRKEEVLSSGHSKDPIQQVG